MIGALIAWAVAAILQVIVVLLVLEGYLLATGQEPITWYTRRVENVFPGPAVAVIGLLMLVMGALFAHFVWDSDKESPEPPVQ